MDSLTRQLRQWCVKLTLGLLQLYDFLREADSLAVVPFSNISVEIAHDTVCVDQDLTLTRCYLPSTFGLLPY